MLKAIRNHIIFQFTEKIRDGRFIEITNWGFEIGRMHQQEAKNARFGVIKHVGHEVPDELQPGMTVLIEPLRWSNGFNYNGETYWRTDSDHIIGIQPENATT